jgi:ACR3 family arsenite efflux pump ArsB
MEKDRNLDKGIGFFEKYLTLWVALCMILGVLIGRFCPAYLRSWGASSTQTCRSPLRYSSGS